MIFIWTMLSQQRTPTASMAVWQWLTKALLHWNPPVTSLGCSLIVIIEATHKNGIPIYSRQWPFSYIFSLLLIRQTFAYIPCYLIDSCVTSEIWGSHKSDPVYLKKKTTLWFLALILFNRSVCPVSSLWSVFALGWDTEQSLRTGNIYSRNSALLPTPLEISEHSSDL